jgi:hypothetical protein
MNRKIVTKGESEVEKEREKEKGLKGSGCKKLRKRNR